MLTPDDFPRDPLGYMGNQCGHAMIGLAISVLGAVVGLWWPLPIGVALVYYLAVEVAQGWSWDGVEDAAFVAAGAALPPAIVAGPIHAAGVLVAGGIWLLIGAARRG